jgi:Werner syndrome ATP-dependent helicase
VFLPVPQAIAAAEAAEAAKAQASAKELEDAGVDVGRFIPSSEVELGSGPTFAAFQSWVRTLSHHRSSGREAKAEQLEALLAVVLGWRQEVAEKLGMAPHDVLAEPLTLAVASTQCSSSEALTAIGVRVAGAEELACRVEAFVQSPQGNLLGPRASSLLSSSSLSLSQASSQGGGGGSQGGIGGGAGDQQQQQQHQEPMAMPEVFTPAKAWSFAVYKVTKKGVGPPWEASWQRFMNGQKEPIEAIAMTQPGGKAPLAPTTVRGHLLKALLHGRPVALKRLAASQVSDSQPPSVAEWELLEEAEAAEGMCVVGSATFERKPLLRRVLTVVAAAAAASVAEGGGGGGGSDLLSQFALSVDNEHATKSDAQRAVEGKWYGKIDWWYHLKIAGFNPPPP